MIAERVRAGLARARAAGTVLGRPRIDAGLEQRIRERPDKAGSIRLACQVVGGGRCRSRVGRMPACEGADAREFITLIGGVAATSKKAICKITFCSVRRNDYRDAEAIGHRT
jgi:DNA invertase Pin-like site-specific DNA recombinase